MNVIDNYRLKAKRAKSLFECENALTDIRETLNLWKNVSEGNPYVQKLLTERDAYLERYDELKRKMK